MITMESFRVGPYSCLIGIGQPGHIVVPLKSDGTFFLGGLPPDNYRLSIAGIGGGILLKSIAANGTQLDPMNLDVDKSIEGLAVLLTASVGKIDGTVDPLVSAGIAIALSASENQRRTYLAPVTPEGKFKFEIHHCPGTTSCFVSLIWNQRPTSVTRH